MNASLSILGHLLALGITVTITVIAIALTDNTSLVNAQDGLSQRTAPQQALPGLAQLPKALYEKENQYPETVLAERQLQETIERSSRFFVSQVVSPYNQNAPGDYNLNCGPAALVMAFRQLGETQFWNEDPQQAIDRARLSLTGRLADEFTSLEQMESLAGQHNLYTERLSDIGQLKLSLEKGAAIIALGNPFASGYAARIEKEAYGPCGTLQNKGCRHFIVVAAYVEGAAKYIINDPLSKNGPILISESEMKAYLDSGVALSMSRSLAPVG
ncbi:MAG: C39 family peptidase [Candidatus Obscuribacter sp.]|nr:C39 family peptidase [Candidatus Obscuribacter sp.]